MAESAIDPVPVTPALINIPPYVRVPLNVWFAAASVPVSAGDADRTMVDPVPVVVLPSTVIVPVVAGIDMTDAPRAPVTGASVTVPDVAFANAICPTLLPVAPRVPRPIVVPLSENALFVDSVPPVKKFMAFPDACVAKSRF